MNSPKADSQREDQRLETPLENRKFLSRRKTTSLSKGFTHLSNRPEEFSAKNIIPCFDYRGDSR